MELARNLGPAVLAVIAALGAAMVAGHQQRRTAAEAASRQSHDRREERDYQTQLEQAKHDADRAFALLSVARHLEAYARACADVVDYNETPYQQRQHDDAAHIPDFPEWPQIDWRLLGAVLTARARDIEERVSLRLETVKSGVEWVVNDAEDAREHYSEGAALIGLDAWNAAQALRTEASVPAFVFPEEGWNYSETLINKMEKLESERLARRRDYQNTL